MAVWQYFNDSTYDGPVSLPPDSIFVKAVELLLPNLPSDDHRFNEVVKWAKEDYCRNGKCLTLLARIDCAKVHSLVRVSSFLRDLELNPEGRVVLISDKHIFFSLDYSIPPEEVS